MQYIIFDLELNSKTFKSKLPNEIIEIGAVKLDQDLKEIDTFQSFVKPRVFKKLCPIIKRKTRITQAEINVAENFNVVLNLCKEWAGNDYILCSWGYDDIHHLKSNCEFNRLSNRWIKTHFDIQKKLSKHYELPLGHQLSLKNALNLLTIPVERNLHRADADAHYTAIVFIKTFDILGLQQCPAMLEATE
jgi:3'-5' exoribonuclease 1